MSLKSVVDIKEDEVAIPIEIRVLKKWLPYHKNKDTTKLDICYLFVDEHGDAIEATADMNYKEYFDSVITVQSCYIIDNYVCLPQKTHTPAVPHRAYLRLGKKTTITPTMNCQIPDHYYSFATFDDLKSRTQDPKMLTGKHSYKNKVKDDRLRSTKTGINLRKLTIQDESRKGLEITFWPDQAHIIPKTVPIRSIVAITATSVTVFKRTSGSEELQLETTPASTITINPTSSDIRQRVNMLKDLPSLQSNDSNVNVLTLAQLKAKIPNEQPKTFRCLAHIKSIQTNQKWYYVICPKCPKKMYMQKGSTTQFVCEDHDTTDPPKFLYCINATIIDDTAESEAVFFDHAMSSLLGTTCHQMITTKGYSDQWDIPYPVMSQIGKPKLMMVTLKNNKTVVVNDVTEPTPSTTLTLPTPAAKNNQEKRAKQTDSEARKKKPKT